MLESLLYPSSVAVMGASRTPGKVGHAVVANLVEGGFEGDIVPVNPSGGHLMKLKVYSSLAEYGKPVDMSVIAVPTDKVKEAVNSSLDAGAKTIVVITAGFKEVDEAGARLELEIAELCRDRGARLLGPNSLGLINTHHKLNAAFASFMPKVGGISVLSQSGALCSAILDWATSREVGLATLLSMGNKADLCETDFLAAFLEDDKTKVVAGYLESISNGEDFIRVAESVAAIKPVVILKGGTTTFGSKAASSHTGALAGADNAYQAAFKRAGIIRADTFEALFDFATAFAMQPLPQGDRVAIITNAGGPGTMAADAVARSDMRMASIDADVTTGLSAKLPAAARVGNPIDVLEDAKPERYEMALRAVLDDPGVDAVIVILTPQAMTEPVETARAIVATAQGRKPVLAAFMGGGIIDPSRPSGVGAQQPAQLPVPGASGGSSEGDVGLHQVASAAAQGDRALSDQPAGHQQHDHPSATSEQDISGRSPRQGDPEGLRLRGAGRPAGEYGGRSHRSRLPTRVSPGHEDRLARYHPQVRRGWSETQPQHPSGSGRRLRAHDDACRPQSSRGVP